MSRTSFHTFDRKEDIKATDGDEGYMLHQIYFLDNLANKNEFLTAERQEKFDSGSAEIHINAATLVLQFYTRVLDSIAKAADGLLSGSQPNIVHNMKHFIGLQAQLYHLDFYLVNAMLRPQDDLFYLPESDDRWVKLREHLKIIDYGDGSIPSCEENITIISSMFAAQTHVVYEPKGFFTMIKMGYKLYRYSSDKAERETQLGLDHMTMDVTGMGNLFRDDREDTFLKRQMAKQLEPILFTEYMAVNQMTDPITLENIDSLPEQPFGEQKGDNKPMKRVDGMDLSKVVQIRI